MKPPKRPLTHMQSRCAMGPLIRRLSAGVFPFSTIACLTALLLGGCLGPDKVAGNKGGGTETESNVAGRALNDDGSPAIFASVRLRSADYLEDLVSTEEVSARRKDTVTDNRGRFSVKGLPPGDYRVEIAGSEARGYIRDFSVPDSGLVQLGADTVKPRGSILGTFAPDSEVQLTRFVQVLGMERLITADHAGGFVVYNLPAGTYSIRCSSLQPFRRDAVLRNIEVRSGEQTKITSVQLKKEAKLAFTVDAVGLKIAGMDAGDPVIFDNERWDNGVDNEYIWAKASLGALDLRGNIVTNDHRSALSSIPLQLALGREELRLAQLSGMRNIPDLLGGATDRLVLPASGRLEDIPASPSAGSDLIVAEARKATPEKPLLVVAGGPLTTVAQAYLTDPSIASRMVVAGIFTYSIQVSDTIANYLVAKKCRFVQWGRTYTWGGKADTTRSKDIPLTRMGEKVRAYLSGGSPKLSYGDIAPVAFLFNRGVWKTAQMVKVSSTLEVQPASDITFDFLDIAEAANDWPAYTDEFFATLSNPDAYAPKAIPGSIPAEGYLSRSGVTAIAFDSVLASGGIGYTGGAWTDYRVSAEAAGKFAVSLRYRSGAGGHMFIGLSGHPPLVEADLPASSAWSSATLDSIPLAAGTTLLRIGAVSGKVDLIGIDLR